METLSVWWSGLIPLNQWFFIAAAFFSVFFVWQLVMSLAGIGGGDSGLDSHAEAAWEHHTPDDAQQTDIAFKLLSVRSILAFFTLFTWAGALYMSRQVSVVISLLYALAWGAAAMLAVSALMYLLRHMADTGTIQIDSCVGKPGTVYLDIPAGGEGEVRTLCSGVMTHLKARAEGGAAVKAGTPVRVVRTLGPNTIEVKREDSAS